MMENDKSKEKRWVMVKKATLASTRMLVLVWRFDKTLFIANLVSVLIPAITPFVMAYVVKLLIDIVVMAVGGGTVDYNQILLLLGVLLVLEYLLKVVFSVQAFVTQALFIKLPIYLYELVLNKITSLDVQYFEDSNFRDTLQKVGESYDFRPLNLTYNLFFTFQTFTQMTIALIAMLSLSPILAGLILLTALPELFNQLYFSRTSWGIWDDNTPYRKRYIYLAGLLQNAASIKELKIFQTASRFVQEIKQIQSTFYKENLLVMKKQLAINSGLNIIDSFVLVGIAGYLFFQALAQRITVGDINFYTQVVQNFNQGVYGMFRNLSRIFEQALYVNSIFDLLAVESKITAAPNPIKVDFHKAPVIEFRDVTFIYPGTKNKILDHFSLTLQPGEKVAFVGENGAGKTTLVKLIARFYDVNEGEILVDGKNVKDLDLESWYRSIGVLFQDFVKYEYPVKDNIFFGKVWEKANLDAIIDAAKSAGAHPMISRFDEEYHQMLGRTFEKGIEPSGGQWQKIALARAFFRKAPILVLDEPTAAIDAKAESEIFERVEKLSKDKTVIIISHRFSTVRNADKIYVIDKGRISEQGSHQQLMKLNGAYAKLFNLQARGYLKP